MDDDVPIRIVSSLADINTALEDLDIVTPDQAAKVQFQLHEQTSLQEALNMKTKTRPGRHGFRLLNPELLDCKLSAKTELDISFNRMLDATIERCDEELRPIEASIAALKVFELYTDQQIPYAGPDLLQRNRGVQHMIYPHPRSRKSLGMSMVTCNKESLINQHLLQIKRGMLQLLVTGVLRGQFGTPNSVLWRRGNPSWRRRSLR